MLSLLKMGVRLYPVLVAAALCLAQEAATPDGPVYNFGITAVGSAGLKGDIYLLKEGTELLPNFRKLKPIGSVYTPALFIPVRNFREGFPGITDRFEWFAVGI